MSQIGEGSGGLDLNLIEKGRMEESAVWLERCFLEAYREGQQREITRET